jgi:hypothetical protein
MLLFPDTEAVLLIGGDGDLIFARKLLDKELDQVDPPEPPFFTGILNICIY